jgi:Family of unknown function (DUF5764)
MTDTEFAKSQLRDHLASLIVPAVSDGLWSIHNSAKELCDRNGQQVETIRTFQNMLTKIPEWSETTLDTEVDRITKATKCKYLDDLVMGVFIAYMKSFAALHYRGRSSQVSVDFERPTLAKFVHTLYIHSARKIWQVAYLFRTTGVPSEQQARNRQDIEKLIRECMEQVIHSFLPWESITKSLAGASAEPILEEDSESEEDEEVEKKNVKFEDMDDEDEEVPKVTLGEDIAEIEVEELDQKEEPVVEDDPMKDIEKKATDTLVLKL